MKQLFDGCVDEAKRSLSAGCPGTLRTIFCWHIHVMNRDVFRFPVSCCCIQPVAQWDIRNFQVPTSITCLGHVTMWLRDEQGSDLIEWRQIFRHATFVLVLLVYRPWFWRFWGENGFATVERQIHSHPCREITCSIQEWGIFEYLKTAHSLHSLSVARNPEVKVDLWKWVAEALLYRSTFLGSAGLKRNLFEKRGRQEGNGPFDFW